MKLISTLVAAIAMIISSTASTGDIIPPDTLVKNTATEVIDVIKKDKDIQAGDMKKIVALTEEKILPHFDFERMSKIVLGRNWSKASKEQQTQFVSEFRTLLVRTYSSALAKYRNQAIEYKPLRAAPGDTDVTVKTQIVQPGGPPVLVDYSLQKRDDGWKVYDVVIEGVSLVTNYRGQFSNEIKQGGMDGLIQKLADKNKQGTASASDKKQS